MHNHCGKNNETLRSTQWKNNSRPIDVTGNAHNFPTTTTNENENETKNDKQNKTTHTHTHTRNETKRNQMNRSQMKRIELNIHTQPPIPPLPAIVDADAFCLFVWQLGERSKGERESERGGEVGSRKWHE